MQAQQGQAGMGGFPDRRHGVVEALRRVHHRVRDTQVALEGQRIRRGGRRVEPAFVAEFHRHQVFVHAPRAVGDARHAARVAPHPRGKLEVHGAQLARQAQGFQRELVAPPELVAQIGRHAVVVDDRLRPSGEFAADVGGQGGQRRLVAGEQPEGLDIEDEIVWRPRGPQIGVFRRGHGIEAGIDLGHGKARRIKAQPGFGAAGLGRVEPSAGQQGGVGPGGGAGQDARRAGGHDGGTDGWGRARQGAAPGRIRRNRKNSV
ncbi:hypothetical protein D3C85_1144360 [compost metagenome]